MFTHIDAHSCSLILTAVYYSVTQFIYPFPFAVYLGCYPFFSIINNAVGFVHISLYICVRVSPGYVPEVELLNNGVVFSSAILDIAGLLSKVAVPNYYTWNNTVWVSHFFIPYWHLCSASLMRSNSFLCILLKLSIFSYVHWLYMFPRLWFAHYHAIFHLCVVFSWKSF